MRYEFKDQEELIAIRADLESQGLLRKLEHMNNDEAGSGYIECMDAEESATARKDALQQELMATDIGLARGLEDLINILEQDDMNIRGRLPQALQDKLARREELRGLISG